MGGPNASLRVNQYEDDLGVNAHPFAGPDGNRRIAQIYALSQDRRTIYSNDYWVSTDWRRISCGPLRSGLQLQSLSASGSTMFVLTKQGDMFTRYWNYNTSGASAPTNLYTMNPNRAKLKQNFSPPDLSLQNLGTNSLPFMEKLLIASIFSTGHARIIRLLRIEGRKTIRMAIRNLRIFMALCSTVHPSRFSY